MLYLAIGDGIGVICCVAELDNFVVVKADVHFEDAAESRPTAAVDFKGAALGVGETQAVVGAVALDFDVVAACS